MLAHRPSAGPSAEHGSENLLLIVAAAYKPEVAATLGSCMQDMLHGFFFFESRNMLHGLKAGLEGQPNVTV